MTVARNERDEAGSEGRGAGSEGRGAGSEGRGVGNGGREGGNDMREAGNGGAELRGRRRGPYDIYIVGLGIESVRHVTREAEAALRCSSHIYYVAAGFGFAEYFDSLGVPATDLHPAAYREGVPRVAAYDIMASTVLQAALENPPVSFAVYGHPMVYVYPSQAIVRAAAFLGLGAKVMPGISALDTILVDLGLDPGIQGLQMYDATELLVRKRPLQPDVPCLLWQVGAVETSLYTEGISRPERFTRLLNHLYEFYPPDHRVMSVYSSTHPLIPSQRETFTLREMPTHCGTLHQALTLYIPPVTLRPVLDTDLREQLESAEHLVAVTVAPPEDHGR